MLWINVYKASLHPEWGFLTSSYYADFTPSSYADFWNFAPNVAAFDMAFEGNQTTLLAITAQPAQSGGDFVGDHSYLYAPAPGSWHGARNVPSVLPWRWCLNVGFMPFEGRAHHHWHHYALDHDEAQYSDKGRIALKLEPNWEDLQNGRLGEAGSRWRQWLRLGYGSATPGNALSFGPVQSIRPVGISLMNKARKHQAQILKQAVTFQGKIVGSLALGGLAMGELLLLHSEDTGHWIRERLRPVTTEIMGLVIAMAQLHKDNNKGENGQDCNDGNGWNVRFGPDGKKIADKLDFFKQKQEEDMKWLQKFPPFPDVQGDMYFENPDAQQWFTVADDWVSYLGAFGGFDFLNVDQTGLEDMSRLDNYTPWYPDLPLKVVGLPKPHFPDGRNDKIPDTFLE